MRISRARPLILLFFLFFGPVAAENENPVGQYSARAGERAQREARDTKQLSSVSSTTLKPGTVFSVDLTSFTADERLKQLEGLKGPGLFEAIASSSHGTVTIKQRTYPINLATWEATKSGGQRVHLVSSIGFESGYTADRAKGSQFGYLTFEVGSHGRLVTLAQVFVRKGGKIFALGAKTRTTRLEKVVRE